MRISTPLMYQQNMHNVTEAQSEWLNNGEHLSTGKKIITPSDDPISAAQVVVVGQAQAQNEQYGLARIYAKQRESLADNILSQVVSAVQSAEEKMVAAGNGTFSDDDRQSVATNLQGIRDLILNLANSTDGNGRYVFAGYKTDKPPFVPVTVDGVTRIHYQGGDEAISQQVDSARKMVVGHTGRQVFMTLPAGAIPEPADATGTIPPSEASIFNTLDDVIEQLKTPTVTDADRAASIAAVDKANRGLHNFFNNVLAIHAEVGVQLSELSSLDDLGAQRDISLKLQRSSLEDVDWNQAISDYKLKMYALNASYQAFTDMKGLSLFTLNR